MIAIYVAATALIAFVLGLVAAALIVRFGRGSSTSSWTPEHIAYNLMGAIAKQEGKSLNEKSDGARPDRKWLLDTYAECMQAVREPSHRLDAKK
jgi:hypothetical protein